MEVEIGSYIIALGYHMKFGHYLGGSKEPLRNCKEMILFVFMKDQSFCSVESCQGGDKNKSRESIYKVVAVIHIVMM